MPPRKRAVQGSKTATNGKDSPPTEPQSDKHQNTVDDGESGSSGVDCSLIVVAILLLTSLGATVYVYNYVDVQPLLDTYGLSSWMSPQSSSPSQSEGTPPLSENTPSDRDVPKPKEPNGETSDTGGAQQQETQSTKKKERYKKAAITNSADNKIRQDLDEAEDLLEKGKTQEALVKYALLLAKYPKSPRAVYGKACVLDKMAELERSNKHLEEAIDNMLAVLDLPDVPKELLYQVGKKCADRQTFRGWGYQATKTIQRLLEVDPDDTDLWNTLGVKYLMIHRNEDARGAFKEVLRREPDNGFALVHLGFILKAIDHKYSDAIPYLRDGIHSNATGVIDGRFFFHLGDALHRTGKPEEALSVYELGAEKGVFMSKWQRSLYNVESLTARPWWTLEQTGSAKYLKMLEDNWEVIRDEGLAQMDPKSGAFLAEDEDLRESGDWKQFTLYVQGRKNAKNCAKAPRTCAIIDQFTESATCKRGQVKFSIMQPGVHVWPHCGPTNCRLRAHLGLVIPEGVKIRVVDDYGGWEEGKVFVFDDSFEHEVWHDGDSFRLVLIVDMWHPELTARQKQILPAI